jgi:hypothetical protein
VNAEAPTNWADALRGGEARTAADRKRLMYVAGQLADLAVSLRNRATATSTKRKTLGDEANDHILDTKEELEEMEIAELKPVLAAVEKFDKKSLREVTGDDERIYGTAADAVTAAAEAFVKAHQGGGKLPKSIKVPSKVKGVAFEG